MSYNAENLKTLSNIKHCFFSRKGGFSKGLCSGLNISFKNDDKESVLKNMRMVEKYFDAKLSLVVQEHTNKVIYIFSRNKSNNR